MIAQGSRTGYDGARKGIEGGRVEVRLLNVFLLYCFDF